ncbi:MAG: class I SAM-dependent methyltransferase [Candidatus Bathyarchaeota archaeon]|nr:class I SAM-dependent methyltransferase [Candidatus Bathyarchaeota archaeon]
MTYRQAAKFYDLFGSKNDLEFYKELALQSGNKALELGVGTARVAISIAKVGVTVVGIDNSVYMLRVAKEKLTRESEPVRRRVILKKGDMRSFELGQSFPFIYIPASTFDHNVTVEDRKQTLNCVFKHLKKNGTFAFDLEQAAPDKPEKSWWIDRKETEDGKTGVRSIFTRKNTLRRTLSLDLFYDVYKNGKLLERYHEYGEVATISNDEIVGLLEETGFKVVSIYGDFDKSEYQKGSAKIVLVTRRK